MPKKISVKKNSYTTLDAIANSADSQLGKVTITSIQKIVRRPTGKPSKKQES